MKGKHKKRERRIFRRGNRLEREEKKGEEERGREGKSKRKRWK